VNPVMASNMERSMKRPSPVLDRLRWHRLPWLMTQTETKSRNTGADGIARDFSHEEEKPLAESTGEVGPAVAVMLPPGAV
jgi:hypothetical protein